ncbi:hypothetical protein SME38J_11980 [Serratia marcescens]|nr:hypothetical protein SME38J_11980 [Serratia marcescens]
MARCMLFFGLVAPPVGGVIMFLLMTFGSGELVEIGRLEADDMLGMLALIGAFSYAFGFLPAVWWGPSRVSSIRYSPIAVVSAVMRDTIRHCSWFAECRSAYFWYDRGFTGYARWIFMVAPEITRCPP